MGARRVRRCFLALERRDHADGLRGARQQARGLAVARQDAEPPELGAGEESVADLPAVERAEEKNPVGAVAVRQLEHVAEAPLRASLRLRNQTGRRLASPIRAGFRTFAQPA